MGELKTTLELPEDLMRAVKIRAAKEGRKLKEVVADLLRRGLRAEAKQSPRTMRRVRLPLIECAHDASAGQEMTPDRLAEILADEDSSAARSSS
jgi:plasmid stability protein